MIRRCPCRTHEFTIYRASVSNTSGKTLARSNEHPISRICRISPIRLLERSLQQERITQDDDLDQRLQAVIALYKRLLKLLQLFLIGEAQ